ncbi:MAG: CooT family nickel-binding protein [Candidatus Bathyarchaeia archaeon]
MCEFTVLFKGEEVFKDAIYAKAEGSKVILKDVLGDSKMLENCRITEIDVSSERLVLSSTEASR